MDSDELRRACERAGLEVRPRAIHNGWEAGFHAPGVVWWYDDEDPALPAYVASLLVAMVPDKDSWALHLAFARQFDGLPPPYMKATDEQRIRAAMEVLGDG